MGSKPRPRVGRTPSTSKSPALVLIAGTSSGVVSGPRRSGSSLSTYAATCEKPDEDPQDLGEGEARKVVDAGIKSHQRETDELVHGRVP